MSSLFRPSAETGKDVRAKIFVWGPAGAGKTHFALGAPKPALLDLENRARNFAQREGYDFLHAEIANLDELAEAFKELRSGKIPCESIVTDSGSAIYTKLVEEHTARTDRGAFVTDWVTVNRRFLKCLNFVFEISGKNVIFTGHAATKLVRNGRDFVAQGLKFVGDDRFRFGFDYIFRIEPKGDPTKVPAVFHVEKTSSPNMHVGQAIPGLTWAKFIELTTLRGVGPALGVHELNADNGGAARPVNSPKELHDDGSPIATEQIDKIEVLTQRLKWSQMQLADACKRISRVKNPIYKSLTAAEADRMIAVLEQRLKGAA